MLTFTLRLLVAVAILSSAPAVRAQVPDSDIWLADIEHDADGLHLVNLFNVTHRPGYDNQPAFLWRWKLCFEAPSTAGLLFVAADSLGTTDIFRWDRDTKRSVRVTHTVESEYSPTPFMRGHAGLMSPNGFDCVRVEADSTQRLWRFGIDGSNPRLLLSDVDSVGYFAWIDEDHLAAFVLGNEKRKEPHTLRIIEVATQRETIVARGIGRSITRIPGAYDISFTVQDDDDTYRFMRLRQGGTVIEPLIDAMGTGQDAAWIGHTSTWMSDTMLMSAGTAIYASDPAPGRSGGRDTWHQVADFARQGISGITRMVVSPDQRQIAFVATTTTP